MRKRRGRGEGAIYQRADGLWCASVTFAYDENGKRRRKVVYGSTKHEVRDRLTKLSAQVQDGTVVEPTRLTVVDYLRHWLEHSARPSIRESTYVCYEGHIRNHIVPYVGGIKIAKLQAGSIQALYSQLNASGKAARTIEMVHAILHRAFKQAMKWGYVSRNPCDAVDKPRVTKRSMTIWNEEQIAAFLNVAAGDRLYALYVMALATGLRQGEILALRWDDVDLKTHTAAIQHTLLEVQGKIQLGEPKSAKGRRSIELPDVVVDALRTHRKRMFEEGHRGVEWLFCDSTGGPLRKSNLRRRSFEPLQRLAAVPRIRFHDLRHTAATMLLRQGVNPKVVQELLGHAQIRMTLDTYSHVLPSMQHDAAQRIDSLFRQLGEKK